MTSAEAISLSSGKGCHVPIALVGTTLVYHFRSPTEAGDLWVHDRVQASTVRVTHTMPVSLRAKLSPPEELCIAGRHALLYRPPPSEAPAPAIVWAHGEPMTVFSYDFNPIAAWLASQGYLVAVPNFAGSVGFGVRMMDQVLGDGCGVADLEDCVACAELCALSKASTRVAASPSPAIRGEATSPRGSHDAGGERPSPVAWRARGSRTGSASSATRRCATTITR